MDRSSIIATLVDVAHRLAARGYVVGMDGNLSVRIGTNRFLVTRANSIKESIRSEDILEIDSQGLIYDGVGTPTSEWPLHRAAYEERLDIQAVVHAHPPKVIAAMLGGIDLTLPWLPEQVATLGSLPMVPYATTGTVQLAEATRPYFCWRDAILLERHGAITLGSSLTEAALRLDMMEHLASIVLLAHSIGKPVPLPRSETLSLRRLGLSRYGGPPLALARIDHPDIDLPLPFCSPQG